MPKLRTCEPKRAQKGPKRSKKVPKEMVTMVSLFYVENAIRKALTIIHAENVIMTQDAALHINPKTMNATRLNGLRINTKLSQFILVNR